MIDTTNNKIRVIQIYFILSVSILTTVGVIFKHKGLEEPSMNSIEALQEEKLKLEIEARKIDNKIKSIQLKEMKSLSTLPDTLFSNN